MQELSLLQRFRKKYTDEDIVLFSIKLYITTSFDYFFNITTHT